MKIYYKSDFQIIERFFDAKGEAINISDLDIEIIYTTSGWEKYEVSKLTDSGLTNCYFEEIDPTKLHIVFQNHNLKPGLLIREITLFVNNINFESGTQKVMLKPETDIELVSKGGEQRIVQASTSIPFVVSTSTVIEKENIKDTDNVLGLDSENGNGLIKITLLKLKAFLKPCFDTFFQKKNIILENTIADVWTADSTYEKFRYKCEITVSELTENDIANVIYSNNDSISGNYSSICLTSADKLTIYSKVNSPITIPTIKISKS